ncbi:MAG: hypothetical protein ACREN5_08415, partial [Gemmatimonadales bacterium]
QTPNRYTLTNFQLQVFTSGCWFVRWINPKDGAVLSSSTVQASTGLWYSSSPPPFLHDVVALVSLFRAGSCY